MLSAFLSNSASVGIPIPNSLICFRCLTTCLHLFATAASFLLVMLSVVNVLRGRSLFGFVDYMDRKDSLLTRCFHSYGSGLPPMQSPYQPGLPLGAANGHGLPGSSDGPNGSNGDGHDSAFSQQLP